MLNALNQTNPLIARQNRKRALRLAGFAAAALAGATLLFSVGVSAEPKAAPVAAPQVMAEAVSNTPAPIPEVAAKPARPIRVIQIWNVSKDQQGL